MKEWSAEESEWKRRQGKQQCNSGNSKELCILHVWPDGKYIFCANICNVWGLSEFATHSPIFLKMTFPILFYLIA